MLKPIGLIGIGLTALIGFFHYVTRGPNEVEPEDEEAARHEREKVTHT
jgi:formate dehydrogenase iron-sulfur subunit